jgi:RHS repeat-associated protein
LGCLKHTYSNQQNCSTPLTILYKNGDRKYVDKSENITEGYKFGFNGKENDNEVSCEGNQQDYGMRIYNNRLGRFLSADPLIISSQKYPELSPYQFASNRPIDGIDLDGLEYATFTIFIQSGKVMMISVKTDYELKDKNSLGPGVLYNYAYVDKKLRIEKFEQGALVTNMYGIYQGSDNPRLQKVGGDPLVTDWDYRLAPLDKQDAYALKHDLAYDNPET